ncbi:hypothetical protein M3J09_011528 [Ascochyta lentis]
MLIAKEWNVNLNLGHMGDALTICEDFLDSAFSLATGLNDLDMVYLLLSQGADPNANTDNRMYRAVEQGAAISSITVLKALLNARAESLETAQWQ